VTIDKPVGETNLPGAKTDTGGVSGMAPDDESEAEQLLADLQERMAEAADNLEFELAADIRDRIRELRQEYELQGEDDGVVPEPAEEF
jgi:excinuclease ABC subunit B